MPTPRSWLIAFLLTVIVEAPIVLALTRDSETPAAKRLALIIFAQLATHPLVWFVFPQIAGLTDTTTALLSELWAWLAETVFYALVLRNVSPARALGISALANGASVLAGVALSGVIRALSA